MYQLNLFRKGVKSLEAVEPHVRLAAEQQHIDHQFSALEDEDYSVEDENDDDYNDSHDGELSFDYGESKESAEAGHASRSPTEVLIYLCNLSIVKCQTEEYAVMLLLVVFLRPFHCTCEKLCCFKNLSWYLFAISQKAINFCYKLKSSMLLHVSKRSK